MSFGSCYRMVMLSATAVTNAGIDSPYIPVKPKVFHEYKGMRLTVLGGC